MGRVKISQQENRTAASDLALREAVPTCKVDVWRRLTPVEQLRRSRKMRSRIPDPEMVLDRKLFPKP
jgi:hypothetical protein